MSMRAVVYDRPREFAIREVPVGDPGAGEVRIRESIHPRDAGRLRAELGEDFGPWPEEDVP